MEKSVYELKSIIDKIEQTSGTIEKARLLKKFEENKLLLDTLRFLFSSFVTTSISTKKIEKSIDSSIDAVEMVDDFREFLGFLEYECSGKDKDILRIQSYISKFEDESMQEFLKKITCKEVRFGMNAKSINKVIPDLIPIFEVMRGKLACEDEIRKINGDFWITPKYNGIRMIAIVSGYGQIELYTRQGKLIYGLHDIMGDLSLLPDGMVYDGEVVLDNPNNIPHGDNFRLTAGIMNEKGDKSGRGLIFNIFDMMPLSDFKRGRCNISYSDRRTMLDKLQPRGCVQISPVVYHGDDKVQIEYWTKRLENENYEGGMINTDKPYVAAKTNNILKAKNFITVDVLCTDVYEGTKKNKGKLGGITIDFKGYSVGVGSGFTDAERNDYWQNPKLIVGRIVEVKYFEESSNKQGGISLQFPTFVCIRFDKGSEEISYD